MTTLDSLTIELNLKIQDISKLLSDVEKEVKKTSVAIPVTTTLSQQVQQTQQIQQIRTSRSPQIEASSSLDGNSKLVQLQQDIKLASLNTNRLLLDSIQQIKVVASETRKANDSNTLVGKFVDNIKKSISDSAFSSFKGSVIEPLKPLLAKIGQSAIQKGQSFVESQNPQTTAQLRTIYRTTSDFIENVGNLDTRGIVSDFQVLQKAITGLLPKNLQILGSQFLKIGDTVQITTKSIASASTVVPEKIQNIKSIQDFRNFFSVELPQIFNNSLARINNAVELQQRELAKTLSSDTFTAQGLRKLGSQLGLKNELLTDQKTPKKKAEIAQVIAAKFSPQQVNQAIQELGNEIKSKKAQSVEIAVRPQLDKKQFIEIKNEVKQLFIQSKNLIATGEISKAQLVIDALTARIATARKEFRLSAQQSSSFTGSLQNLNNIIARSKPITELGDSQKIIRNWSKTVDAIEQQLRALQNFTDDIGYEIQKDIAEGSPGTTAFIRSAWGKTTKYIAEQVSALGNSIEKGKGKLNIGVGSEKVVENVNKIKSGLSSAFSSGSNNVNEFVNKTTEQLKRVSVSASNFGKTGLVLSPEQVASYQAGLTNVSKTSNIVNRNLFKFKEITSTAFNAVGNVFDVLKTKAGRTGLAITAGFVGISKVGSLLQSAFTTVGQTIASSISNSFFQIKEVTIEAVKSFQVLKTVLGSDFFAAKELGKVQAQAEGINASLRSATNAFAKFRAAAEGTSLSREAGNIFAGFQRGAVAFNLTAEETSGVFLALTQIISKGKITAEEWRQQLSERLPNATTIAAKALGLSQVEFGKALDTGKLKIEDLIKISSQFNKEFSNLSSVDNIVTSLTKLENLVYKTQIKIGTVLAAIGKPIIDAFVAVGNYLVTDFVPLIIGGSIDVTQKYSNGLLASALKAVTTFGAGVVARLGGVSGIIVTIGIRVRGLIEILNGIYGNFYDLVVILYRNINASKQITKEMNEELKASLKTFAILKDVFAGLQQSTGINLGINIDTKQVDIAIEEAKQKIKEITPSETFVFGLIDIGKIRNAFIQLSDGGKIIAGVTAALSTFFIVNQFWPGVVTTIVGSVATIQTSLLSLVGVIATPLGIIALAIAAVALAFTIGSKKIQVVVTGLATVVISAMIAIQLSMSPLIGVVGGLVLAIGAMALVASNSSDAVKKLVGVLLTVGTAVVVTIATLSGLIPVGIAIAAVIAGLGLLIATLTGGSKNIKLFSQELRLSTDYFIKAAENVDVLRDSYYELLIARTRLQKANQLDPDRKNQLLTEAFSAEIKGITVYIESLEEQKKAAYSRLVAARQAGNEEEVQAAQEAIDLTQQQIDLRNKQRDQLIAQKTIADVNVTTLKEQIDLQERENKLYDEKNKLLQTQTSIDVAQGKLTEIEAEKQLLALNKERYDFLIKSQQLALTKAQKTRQEAFATVADLSKLSPSQLTDDFVLKFLNDTTSVTDTVKENYKLAIDTVVTSENKIREYQLESKKLEIDSLAKTQKIQQDILEKKQQDRLSVIKDNDRERQIALKKSAATELQIEQTTIDDKRASLSENAQALRAYVSELQALPNPVDEGAAKERQGKIKDALGQLKDQELEVLDTLKSEQDLRVKQLADNVQKSLDVVEKANQDKEIAIARLVNEGVITADQAEKLKKQSTLNRIDAEIKGEQYRIDQLTRLNKATPSNAFTDQIAESQKKLGELTLSRIEAEKTAQEDLNNQVIEFITAQSEASDRVFDKRIKQLDIVSNSIKSQSELLNAQVDLENAINNLTQVRVDRQKVLLDAQLTDAKTASQKEAILTRIADLESANSDRKIANLLREQEIARNSQVIEKQQFELESAKAALEARRAVLTAQSELNIATQKGDDKEIAIANEKLALANQELAIAAQQKALQDEIFTKKEETLALQQQAARVELATSEAQRLSELSLNNQKSILEARKQEQLDKLGDKATDEQKKAIEDNFNKQIERLSATNSLNQNLDNVDTKFQSQKTIVDSGLAQEIQRIMSGALPVQTANIEATTLAEAQKAQQQAGSDIVNKLAQNNAILNQIATELAKPRANFNGTEFNNIIQGANEGDILRKSRNQFLDSLNEIFTQVQFQGA